MQGFFSISMRILTCPNCRGKGTIITDPCPDCRGTAKRRKKRVLTVHIPPGVRDGQAVRARGEGEPGTSGTSRGDLHVYVRIRPHPLLVRRGDDLFCQVPISFSLAALGGKLEVPTLVGTDEIQIPPGTQNGDLLTLKRRGLPSTRSGRHGDEHVQVFIEVPRKLTKEQRELLQTFGKTEEKAVTPHRKNFLKKVKEYFNSRK
jgi:molecular chaperone DnaJ